MTSISDQVCSKAPPPETSNGALVRKPQRIRYLTPAQADDAQRSSRVRRGLWSIPANTNPWPARVSRTPNLCERQPAAQHSRTSSIINATQARPPPAWKSHEEPSCPCRTEITFNCWPA